MRTERQWWQTWDAENVSSSVGRWEQIMLRISGGRVAWNEFMMYFAWMSISSISRTYSRAWRRVSYEGQGSRSTAHLCESQIRRFVLAGGVSADAVNVTGVNEQNGREMSSQRTQQLPDGQPIAWTAVAHGVVLNLKTRRLHVVLGGRRETGASASVSPTYQLVSASTFRQQTTKNHGRSQKSLSVHCPILFGP